MSRIRSPRWLQLLRAGGASAAAGTVALWVSKVADPPEAGSSEDWLRRRRQQASSSPSAAAADARRREVLSREGISLDKICAAGRATWSGIELCVEQALQQPGDLSQRLPRWREAAALEAPAVVPTPETRRTYAQDVGSSAPSYLDQPADAPRLDEEGLSSALAILRSDGVVTVAGAVSEAAIVELRRHLKVLGGGGPLACPSEVRTSEIMAAAIGCSVPLEPTSGRRHFLLRGTQLAEQEITPLLASLMPLVYRYFAAERPSAPPGCWLNQAPGAPLRRREDVPHLFLSECQLLVSDPGAVSQIWHRDNRQAGLTIILPVTDVDKQVGPTHFLPGTHFLVRGLQGWPLCFASLRRSNGALMAAPLKPGEALIYDARTLHRGLGNSAYDRCRVVVVLRVDYNDTPPPGETLAQTLQARIIGRMLQGWGTLYSSLPAPARSP